MMIVSSLYSVNSYNYGCSHKIQHSFKLFESQNAEHVLFGVLQ